MLLLGTACVVGVAIAPQLPLVGLPTAAAAAAGLSFRGRRAVSVAVLVMGVVLAAVMVPAYAAYAAAGAAAVLIAVTLLPSRPLPLVGALVTAVVAGGGIGSDALAARSAGSTLVRMLRTQAVVATDALRQMFGSAGDWAEQLEAARKALIMLWPSFYVQTAIWASIFVIAAIAWAAHRTGAPLSVPTNRELDLTGHVLWGLVGGLIALAAAPLFGDGAGTARAVAFNLLFVTRTLFFVQGIAVFSALFDVPKTGFGKMIGLYAALWLLDQFLMVVSLVGMLDFWVNFRRLPRDGSGTPARLEEPPASV